MNNKNIFIKDFFKLFSGAFAAQLVGFSISPILSRVYAPSDFGLFTLYIQFLSPLTVLSGGSMYLLLPKLKNKELSESIFYLVMFSSVFLAAMIFFIGITGLGKYLYIQQIWLFLSIGIILVNLRGYFHFQSIAEKKLSINSKAKLIESVTGSVGNIGFGLFNLNHSGLIFGNFIGQLFYILRFYLKRTSVVKFPRRMRGLGMKKIIFEFKKHLFFQSANHLVEFLFVLAFSLLITKLSSVKDLGYFAFTFKIINTPLNLFADYFGQSILNRGSDFNEDKDIFKFLTKIIVLLFIISFGVLIIFKLFGPEIFSVVFGEGWRKSGVIAKVYILGIVSTFIVKSLQYFPNIKNKYEVYSLFSIVIFGLPVLFFVYAFFQRKSGIPNGI